LLSPWQAVVYAKTGVAAPDAPVVSLTDAGCPVTPGEAGAIEAAADAASEGYSEALRTSLAEAVGLPHPPLGGAL
jgi:hypothetical protein